MEQLAYEKLVLITAKSLADQTAERRPVNTNQLVFHRLQPTAGGTSELHS
jgi:hypothetical protein